jgi:Na+/pantothenate symporter
VILDVAIVVAYFGVLVALGFIAMSRARSVEELYVGGMRVGGLLTALSFFTTYFSSVIFVGATAIGWKYGLLVLWKDVFVVWIGTFLAFVLLGPRLKAVAVRLRALSVVEVFEKRFGSRAPAVVAGITMLLGLTVYAISILIGTARAFEVIAGVPYLYALLAVAIITVVYTALGGYLGQVWTQAVQALFMLSMAIAICITSLAAVGGFEKLYTGLYSIDPALAVWPYRDLLPYMALYLSLGFLGWGNPALLMRFIAIRNRVSLKTATVLATTLVAVLTLSLNLASATTRLVLKDSISVPDYAFLYLVQRLFPRGFTVLFLVAVLSASMSTLTAVLATAAQVLVRDLGVFRRVGREAGAFRLVTALLAMLSIALSANPPPMLMVLFGITTSLLSGVLTGPIIYTLFWRKATSEAIAIAIAVSTAIALGVAAYGNFKFPWTYYSFIPTLAASLILPPAISIAKEKISTSNRAAKQ